MPRLFCALALLLINPLQAEPSGTARLDRTSLVVKDLSKSIAFWRDVMRFEMVGQPRALPPSENRYLGWSKEATVRFARLQSSDGAGIGLLEVTQEGFPSLNIEDHPTGHGGIVLVLVATDIEALYARAKAAGAVHKPLGLSPSGRSKHMYLKSPSGHVLEMYELLPQSAD